MTTEALGQTSISATEQRPPPPYGIYLVVTLALALLVCLQQVTKNHWIRKKNHFPGLPLRPPRRPSGPRRQAFRRPGDILRPRPLPIRGEGRGIQETRTEEGARDGPYCGPGSGGADLFQQGWAARFGITECSSIRVQIHMYFRSMVYIQ